MTKLESPYLSQHVAGSVGDVTYYVRRGSQCARPRAGPDQVATDPRITAKQALSTASQAWVTLSADQRAAWDAAAVRPLSGRDFFIQRNFLRCYYYTDPVDAPIPSGTPPSIHAFAAIPYPEYGFISCSWDGVSPPAGQEWAVLVRAHGSGSLTCLPRPSWLTIKAVALSAVGGLDSFPAPPGLVLVVTSLWHLPSGRQTTVGSITITLDPPP
jgi:hypothetical protein